MDYYDGNTVTGLWNYAQHFAMSDNSYSTTFGPSSPGRDQPRLRRHRRTSTLRTRSTTRSISTSTSPNGDLTPNGKGGFSLTSDAQPYYDDCSTRDAVALSGKNIGDVLNSAGVSWGWFQGGSRPSTSFAAALAATGNTGQPTSTFTPNEFKAYFANAANRPPQLEQPGAVLQRPPGRRRAGRNRPVGLQG